MGAEFLVWRYRPALLVFTLFFLVRTVNLVSADKAENNVGPNGKLYPRGNHWAVGHLMGKKSTDNLFGSVERERISYQPLPYPQEGKRPGGHLEAFKYVRGLLRALAGLERQNAAGLSPGVDLDMRREWEQRERDRTVREATDYLLQVWSMKDQDSS